MMEITLETIKQLYRFTVLQVMQGEEIVKHGKCSQWTRRKELKNDRDLIYIKIQAVYKGTDNRAMVYAQFHMEDTEGYFSDAMPPEDYLERELSPGEQAEGGLLFACYRDISPSRLWFDTKIHYENTSDPILIDIALPLPEAQTRTQFFAKEELAQNFSSSVGKVLGDQSPVHETEKLIKDISERCGVPYRKITYGYLLRVALPEGRKQNVILNFSGKDDAGNDLVTIGTLCAPVGNGKNDRVFLKLNPKMAYGAIGISTVKGQEFYVVTETYPVFTISKDIVAYAIQTIAAKGDWLEKKLTGGQDIQ